MKKSLVMLVLMFATAGLVQAAPQQPAGQAGSAAPAQQKKEIKNPAEYNAYMGAIQQTDPTAKAAALEAFLQTYPDSVMKEDALELLMRTYQQTNNLPKTEEAATKLLQANPNNVTALALLSYSKRMQALAGGANAPQKLQQAAEYGQKGISALQTYQKPEGMTDDQFSQLKTQLAGIFNASVGLNALQTKDYASAQSHLAVAAAANPTDFATTYQLALANLDAPQPNYIDGLWYIARAPTWRLRRNTSNRSRNTAAASTSSITVEMMAGQIFSPRQLRRASRPASTSSRLRLRRSRPRRWCNRRL